MSLIDVTIDSHYEFVNGNLVICATMVANERGPHAKGNAIID